MRLLLAEDEKALSKALVKIFEKNNYAVDAVYNGEDALMYSSIQKEILKCKRTAAGKNPCRRASTDSY